MADHLKADLARIAQVSGSLKTLGGEFAAITRVADAGGSAGDAELASALTDFATDWSDKRTQLIGQMRELSELADKAVQEYTATDTTLAHALTGAGKGRAGHGGGQG
jgi:hypothetical protein